MSNAAQARSEYVWPSLPLLGQAANAFNLRREQPFRDLHAVICQHLLPSVVPLFELLFELGLAPTRTTILGKCYSADPHVVTWARSYGCTVDVAPAIHPGTYDDSLRQYALATWQKLPERSDHIKLIGVDHGGYLRTTYPRQVPWRCVFVEHTSRGTHKEESNRDLCVDMARSTPKREIENHVIAEEILYSLRQRAGVLDAGRIGILGMGPIGQAVAHSLTTCGYEVVASDPCQSQQRITETGARLISDPRELVRSSRLLLGCTGSDISEFLSVASGHLLVASCSSSDIEFSSLLSSNKDRLDTNGRDYILKSKGRIFTILDHGFPVNFSWAVRHTHPSIGLTRALTLLSMVQAARVLQTNLYLPLDETFCALLGSIKPDMD